MPTPRARWFLLEEVADQLRLTVPEVRSLIDRGLLSAVVISDDVIRVTPAQLSRFTRGRTCPWPGWALPRDHPDRPPRRSRTPRAAGDERS
jgi:hypothetical protein